MIADPWVWEDFGGPIPCAGAFDPPTPPCQAASLGIPALAGDCGTSAPTHSEAIITWEQMEAADTTAIDIRLPSHGELPEEQGESTFDGSSVSTSSLTCVESAPGTLAPTLGLSVAGAVRSDTTQDSPPDGTYVPDTMGAIGPGHFMEVINGNVSIFAKATGYRIRKLSLNAFFSATPTSNRVNDPRVLFDQHSGRWIVAAIKGTDAFNLIVLAASLTDDPIGAWIQTSYVTDTPGGFADYPTLGVDARGIYIATNWPSVGVVRDELWAIEKAPLVAQPPSSGYVRHWISNAPQSPLLGIERALQPAHTYGNSVGEYLIQTTSGHSTLELYRVDWRSSGPGCATLLRLGTVDVADYLEPFNAPQLGSATQIDVASVGARLMMAVYRELASASTGASGYLWTCHTVRVAGLTSCRWYKIDPVALSVVECGTITDTSIPLSMRYYYPALMVNAVGDMVIGFSGSDADQYAAAYFTGRKVGQLSDVAVPVLLKAGEGPYVVPTPRWGDYSYTTLDPVDQTRFWTIQEYAESSAQNDQWGTWIGQISFSAFDCDNDGTSDAAEIAAGHPDCDLNGKPDGCQPDCNANGRADTCDITGGTSLDCNQNGVPDSCDLTGGTSLDCNANQIPFECEILPDTDCNHNCTADAQEVPPIGSGADCNGNLKPDSCDGGDCNANGRLDACDIAGGTSQDCDLNKVPDSCQPDCNADGTPIACEADCNANGFADDCEVTSGTSLDCNANGTPDECDAGAYCLGTYTPCGADDCNFNGVRDAYDIASGVSQDADADGTPNECENPPLAQICVTAAATWKVHAVQGARDIAINLAGRVQNNNVTSEPREHTQFVTVGGITELRLTLSSAPSFLPANAVTLFAQDRQSCGAGCSGGIQLGYHPYVGASVMTPSLLGSTLVLSFVPALEDFRTYKVRINTTLTRVPQAFEVRSLLADVDSSGRVNASDRSAVASVWTSGPPQFTPPTDIDLNGTTNGADRSIVVVVWTGPQNCAP